MTAEPEPRPYITRVWARNFRSIEYAELELWPLTVLVGPNASGKSNLLDILGFLADAARHGLETAITRRGGIDSIGRRTPTGRVLGPEVGFRAEFSGATLGYSFALTRRGRGEYRVKREFARLKPTDSDIQPFEVELTGGRLTKPNLKSTVKNGVSTDGARTASAVQIINQFNEKPNDQDLNLVSSEPLKIALLLAFSRYGTGSLRESPGFNFDLALDDAKDELGKVGMYHIFPNSLREPLRKRRTAILWQRAGKIWRLS